MSDENIMYVCVASPYSQKGKKGPNQDAIILCQLSMAMASGACALHTGIWVFWPGGAPAAGTPSPASEAPLELAASLLRRRRGRELVVVSLAFGTSQPRCSGIGCDLSQSQLGEEKVVATQQQETLDPEVLEKMMQKGFLAHH